MIQGGVPTWFLNRLDNENLNDFITRHLPWRQGLSLHRRPVLVWKSEDYRMYLRLIEGDEIPNSYEITATWENNSVQCSEETVVAELSNKLNELWFLGKFSS